GGAVSVEQGLRGALEGVCLRLREVSGPGLERAEHRQVLQGYVRGREAAGGKARQHARPARAKRRVTTVDDVNGVEDEPLVAPGSGVRPLVVSPEGVVLRDYGDEGPDCPAREKLIDPHCQAAGLDVVARVADGGVEQVEDGVAHAADRPVAISRWQVDESLALLLERR